MKAAIFDMDGVIVHTNLHHKRAWRDYYERNGKTLTDADFLEHISGKHNDAILAHLFAGQVLEPGRAKQLADEKEALFREIYQPDIIALPGLIAFLKALKEAGIRTAVGTSAPVENLDFVVDALNLRPYFDALLNESMVTRPKPDPEIYRQAMAALGVTPADSIVFEDSMTGIRAGLAAGAKVVGVATTETADTLRPLVSDVITDFREMNLARFMALVS